MGRIFKWIGVALVVAVVAFAANVRLAPDDPAAWHVDPATVSASSPANAYLAAPEGTTAAAPDRASPVFDLSPEALAAAFDRVVMAAPRTYRLAGSPAIGWTTYVQRSRLMGYPDYVSVRAVPVDGGAALIIYSRSRYGEGDLGVNEARVTAWLEELGRAR